MAQAEPTDRASQALEQLPQRRPASLYDIAVQYSILDWYQTITSGDLDFELEPEHLTFMTPLAKEELLDSEGENVLGVHVDLSEPDDPRFDQEHPVRLLNVDRSIRYKLGHSYPANKAGVMTDYSITTHKEASDHHLAGQLDDARGTFQDRFTQWAHSEAAEHVLERADVEDAWIIEALQRLGEDEDTLDRLTEHQEFPLDPTEEDTEREVLITVRLRLPGEDEYRWPGEIPILNEVMVKQKAERFENMSVEDAAGEGVGYVTGEEGPVTGGSAGLLGMYGKKQREHFPDLSADGSQAWRARPVSRTTAAALATADSVFEEFYQGLGESRRLYVLPYLGAHPETISPETFDRFVREVFEPLRATDAGDFESIVNEVFFDRDQEVFPHGGDSPYENVRVATAFTVSGNPDRVFFEATNTDPYRPLALENAHRRIIGENPFDGDGVFASLVDGTDSPLLARSPSIRTMALFGQYFRWTTEPTRSSQESSDTPKAGDIDDVRATRLRQFLTNDGIPIRPLLEEFLHQVIQRQHDRFGRDDTSGIPAVAIVEQYLQLRALNTVDALATGQHQHAGSKPATITSTIPTVSSSNPDATYESRAERLEDFIESHEVLADNDSEQAVFLLGGLVGLVSQFQRHPEQVISSTLVRRYPVDYLTKQSIKEVTNEVMQLTNTYAEEEQYFPARQANEYSKRLPDLMLSANPSEWSSPQSELQWLYALGIAYGTNDAPIDTEE